jgi:hypothetical protein
LRIVPNGDSLGSAMEITPIQSHQPRALASTVLDNLAGLQTITLAYKRRGAGYVDFACLHLQTEEGRPPKHNQTPVETPDEIVSACITQGQEQADTNGHPTHVRASFKLAMAGNGRPRSSPPPVTWPVSVNGDDPGENEDPIERDKVYTLLRDIARDNNAHTQEMVKEVTKLVGGLGSIGDVLQGAATFYSESHRVYREGVDAQADQAYNQASLNAEVQKWEAIAKSIGPGAGLLFKQIQTTMDRRNQGGPVQTVRPAKKLPAFTQDTTAMPKIMRGPAAILTELVNSLTPQQREALPESEAIQNLFTAGNDNEKAAQSFAAFVRDTSALVLSKVYDTLTPSQVGLLTELQEATL